MAALVSSLTDKFSNGGNGKNHDSDTSLLDLADPALMKVVKREGNVVPYDKTKIHRAVGMCLETVAGTQYTSYPEGNIRGLIQFGQSHMPSIPSLHSGNNTFGLTQAVTDQVDTILRLKSRQLSEDGQPAQVGIEAIQDIVEAQLMALGQYEAAKHYILYRDERRRVREESKGISPEMCNFFKAGCSTFTGNNRLLQEVQAFDKFSRFRRDFTPKRRETWPESCQRVIDYYRGHITKIAPGSVPAETWAILHDYLLHHKAVGSMRGVQMAGPALDRCQSGVFNCSFLFMDSPESMSEDLYLLMQGCGVGFSIEEEHAVDKWPRIHAKRNCAPVNYVVEDDTEAWCDATKFGWNHWMDGCDVNFDLSPIRKAGSILKTKGGRASGPEPLRDLLNFDRDLIFRRQRKRLRSIDLLDATCMLHRVGQMGGVRRASGLSLSDKDDLLMRYAKTSEFLDKYPWRNQTNNSAVYEEKPTSMDFMDEWMALAKSGSGERGIFNRGGLEYQMPARRLRGYVLGTNPCLTGGTLVLVADGRGKVTIKELADQGDDVPVFCMDTNGKLQIRYMRHPRVSGYHEPIYKVTLDDGCSIRVTGNHRFMLKDRTYCEARGLKPGMRLRLMTRYTPESVNPSSQSRGDLYRFMGIGGDTYQEHEMIAEFYAGRRINSGEHVHHKDGERLRNDHLNLEIKSGFDHISEHSAGEANPNCAEITNDELLEIGRNLTRSLGRRFSAVEWLEFAKTNGFPQTFSSWRSKSLGSVTAFAKRCSILEGMEELADVDPRVVKTYKRMVLQGLDAEIVGGKVFIHKSCESCGGTFTVRHLQREQCFCSLRCSKSVPESEEVKTKRMKNQAKTFTDRRKALREQQLDVFSELRHSLGRTPQKKEWANACRLRGISTEICRQSSPFISWKALTEAGVDVNHRVVSVEIDGYEDVYNGTVDDFHNFCVGGWDGGLTSKGRRREWWCINAQCGEIILRHKEFCNLSIAIVDVDDTYEEIERKIEIATIWGTIQASMTNFRYLSPEWKQNCEEEALLGVDILGHMDCKLLKPGAPGREEILRRLEKKVIEVNIYWARRFGINPGVALTCGKPSGDSSVFFDKPAGFKPHHGRFYLRRLRFEETNPIAKVLKDAKVPWKYDYDKSGMCVFEFPCRAPDDTIVIGDMTAVEQLENWKIWKQNFTEHNPSITVTVKEHEWIEAGNWVYQNWDIVGGISFYPHDDAIYPLAPYQTIDEQEYRTRDQAMPKEIDWSRILLHEEEDETTLSSQIACTGPGCDA